MSVVGAARCWLPNETGFGACGPNRGRLVSVSLKSNLDPTASGYFAFSNAALIRSVTASPISGT
jgi:hypothetical protein